MNLAYFHKHLQVLRIRRKDIDDETNYSTDGKLNYEFVEDSHAGGKEKKDAGVDNDIEAEINAELEEVMSNLGL